jgi:hypothetical protein
MYVMRAGSQACRDKVVSMIQALDSEKDWGVVVTPWKRKRSNAANSYYWGVIIKMIHEHTGQDSGDLHDYLLGECFGWEVYEIINRKKARPVRRSSDMNVEQFGEFCQWCVAWS